jgi:hypothetical protein
MALEPNILRSTLSSDCTELVITDQTGDYSTDNTGGYRGELKITGIGSMGGSALAISFKVNGGATTTLTEGIDWNVGGTITLTCDAIVTAINLIAGVSAVKVGTDTIYIYPDTTYTLTVLAISSVAVGMTIQLQYRDKLAIKLFVLLQKTTGYETIEVPEYTPSTAASWTITLSEDGYYLIYSVIAPIHVTGATYVLDAIVYLESTETYYKASTASTTALPTDTDYWDPITSVEDFEEGTNTYEDSVDDVVICFSNICAARANKRFVRDAKCNLTDEKRKYEDIRDLIEGAVYAAGESNPSEAQVIIEQVQIMCTDINCGC